MDYHLVNGKLPCFGSFEDNRNLVCLCLLVLKCHILKKLDSSWLGNGWMQQRCILFYRAFRATTDLPKKCICHCTNREAMGRYQGKRREWKLGNVNYSLRVLLSFCYENRRCSRSPFLNFGNCCVSSTLDGWGEWWHFSENCDTTTMGHSQRVFVTQSPCFVTQDVFLQRKRKSSIRFPPLEIPYEASDTVGSCRNSNSPFASFDQKSPLFHPSLPLSPQNSVLFPIFLLSIKD